MTARHRDAQRVWSSLPVMMGTAKTHVAHLLAKLGARDRVQLVITAYQAGLFDT
jgi:DNA-binding NarL/FixJ family response regulator